MREHTTEMEAEIMAVERRSWIVPAGGCPVVHVPAPAPMPEIQEEEMQQSEESRNRSEKQKGYWAAMTAEERQAEMARRKTVAARTHGEITRATVRRLRKNSHVNTAPEVAEAAPGPGTNGAGHPEKPTVKESLTVGNPNNDPRKWPSITDCLKPDAHRIPLELTQSNEAQPETAITNSMLSGLEMTAASMRNDLAALERSIAVMRSRMKGWR